MGGHPLESTAVRLNARDEEKRSESREWRVESGLERRQPFRWLAVTAAGIGGTYARFRELNTVDVAESNCYWDVPAEIDWTGTIVSVQLPPREHSLSLLSPLCLSFWTFQLSSVCPWMAFIRLPFAFPRHLDFYDDFVLPRCRQILWIYFVRFTWNILKFC